MNTRAQLDRQLGYKPVTVALVALYITLLEMDRPSTTDDADTSETKEVLERFRSVSEMAATVQKGSDCDALYSIAAPGVGLCYCLTAVRQLYATVELCVECPCVTAVSAQLTIWKSCYQAALGAWMEWFGLDEDTLRRKYGMETLEQNVLECIRWNADGGL